MGKHARGLDYLHELAKESVQEAAEGVRRATANDEAVRLDDNDPKRRAFSKRIKITAERRLKEANERAKGKRSSAKRQLNQK